MARYLIDSHIFLWAVDTPEQLLVEEREAIEDPSNDVAVSVATFWELSIKLTKGSVRLRPGKEPIAGDYFAKQAGVAGFSIVPINPPEAEYVRSLPKIHKDPFDRLLIAQARLSSRIVMTRDRVFARYPGIQVFVP